MPKHVGGDTKTRITLRTWENKIIHPSSLFPSLFSHSVFYKPLFLLFSLSCLLFLHAPLSSVNCLSLAPLEGDVYYLVLRPLLDFYFSLCGVCSMPLRWKNALLIMIIIIVLALCLKKQQKNKRNVLLNVVQIALEMLCFLKRAQTWVMVPSTPPSGRWE